MKIKTLIASALVCGTLPASIKLNPNGPTPYVVIIGQSDASGHGLTTDLTPDQITPPTNASIWIWGDVCSGIWEPVVAGEGYKPTCIGPELSFAKTLTHPTPLRIIKYAVGSTSLAVQWRSPSAGGPGYCYTHMLITIQDAIAAIPGGGYIAGVIWDQGASDATTLANAQAYQSRLTYFLHDLRWVTDQAHLPIVIVQAHPASPGFPYMSTIAQAQAAVVAGNPDNVMVVTSDLSLNSPTDQHLTGASQYILGQRCAEVLAPRLP